MPQAQKRSAHSSAPTINDRTRLAGMQAIVSLAFAGGNLAALWNSLMRRVLADPTDAAAMVDLATILQTNGQAEQAQKVLNDALKLQRDFCIVHGDGGGLHILAFVTAGDFMTNTPIDFLLNGSNAVLWLRYVDAGTQELADLPDHDVAFLAIGESAANAAVLQQLKPLLRAHPGPIMNHDPDLIRSLTRDGVSTLLAGVPSLLAPKNARLSHEDLRAIVESTRQLGDVALDLAFPIVIRPVGGHAGSGLERFSDLASLATWFAQQQTPTDYYIAPYIDYRGADGLFNKQRIVLIKGKPHPSHMALSEHWIVHYLSAGMLTSAEKRTVEQRWMETFHEDFAIRHAEAFAALHRIIGLDYFGIDSAELPDGRLLVFELDVAMVVHDMDSAEIFPYKKTAMRKLFDAFLRAAEDAATKPN